MNGNMSEMHSVMVKEGWEQDTFQKQRGWMNDEVRASITGKQGIREDEKYIWCK